MRRRRALEWLVVLAVGALCAWIAVQLHNTWTLDVESNNDGHIVVLRYVGLSLAAAALVAVGHRRLSPLPVLLTYVVPSLLGRGWSLVHEGDGLAATRQATEVVLLLAPVALLAWLRRRSESPAAPLPPAFAFGVGAAATIVAIGTHVLAEQPHAWPAQEQAGQAAAVALLAALLVRTRWLPVIIVVPLLLWHEPAVELLYYSQLSEWWVPAQLREYYALVPRSLLAGLVVPAVSVLLAIVRSKYTSVHDHSGLDSVPVRT